MQPWLSLEHENIEKKNVPFQIRTEQHQHGSWEQQLSQHTKEVKVRIQKPHWSRFFWQQMANVLVSSRQQTGFLPTDPWIQFVTRGHQAKSDKQDPWIQGQKSSLLPSWRKQDVCFILFVLCSFLSFAQWQTWQFGDKLNYCRAEDQSEKRKYFQKG